MTINLPPRVRAALYVTVVLGTAIFVPLHNDKILSDVFMDVWSSLSAATSLLAALNVNLKEQ